MISSFTVLFEYGLNEGKGTYKGFEIYKAFGDKVRQLLTVARSNDTTFIFTGIPELVKVTNDAGGESSARRLFVYGKEWEAKVEKEFLIVLYTVARRDPANSGKMIYSFMTNTDGICSAKSPMGMFADALIPNDLAEALKKVN